MKYLSQKPMDYDSAYFDARWFMYIILESDSLSSIVFEPHFDDC